MLSFCYRKKGTERGFLAQICHAVSNSPQEKGNEQKAGGVISKVDQHSFH